jgi:hypothetical protein
METLHPYELACRHAATDQGLDPALDLLRAAGLPVVVEQTGGFCMVLAVYGEDRRYVMVTTQREYDGDGPGWLVCQYPAPADDGDGYDSSDEPDQEWQRVPDAGLVRLVRDALRRPEPWCRDCGADGVTVGHMECQYPGRVSDQ